MKLFVALLLVSSLAYGEPPTIEERLRGYRKPTPENHGLNDPRIRLPVAEVGKGCLDAERLKNVGEIVVLARYADCTLAELAIMETKLIETITTVGKRLEEFAVDGKFKTMTQGSDAARYAVAKSALGIVRLQQAKLFKKTGKCLAPEKRKDTGSVVLFLDYQNCTPAELKEMADLLVAESKDDRNLIRQRAILDFDGFTESGAASRLAMAQSSLFLILSELRFQSEKDYRDWNVAQKLALVRDPKLPGEVVTAPYFSKLSAEKRKAAEATAVQTADKIGKDLRENAVKNWDTFTEPNKTARWGLSKAAQGLLQLERMPFAGIVPPVK